MKKKQDAPQISRQKPTLEQWTALYEVAENLKILAPWRALADVDILLLELPGQNETVYCSISGMAGMDYNISIYPGTEAYLRLKRIIDQDAYQPELLMLEMDCLTCHFGSREDIDPEDREVMKQLGLRFRGRNQWIYFRAMKPGHFPWYLDAGQAELLISALQNVAMLCLCYMEGKLPVDFEAGETLLRFYDSKKELWMNAVVPMPQPKLERSFHISDELLLPRLKKCPKTAVKLEVDSFYLPIHVQENKKSPPAGMYTTLLADRESGMILDQHNAAPTDGDLLVAISMLIHYIEECGRPSAVYVRSEWMGACLRSFCQEVGIKLVEGKGVPVVDGLIDELMGILMMGLFR